MNKNSTKFAEALRLHQQGHLSEAVSKYETVLRREPKNVGAANLLGVALVQLNRSDEAIDVIRKVLRADPNQPAAHYNLGTILQALNRHQEAVEHYQSALRLNANDVQTLNNLGLSLRALGKLDEAIKAYSDAVRLKPDFVQAHINLAAVLTAQGHDEESLQSGQRALTLDANSAEANLVVGNALHSLGRSFEGLEAIDRAIKLQPGRAAGYLYAGNIMLAIDFEDRAVPHFREALRLGSKSVSTYFKLAMCLYSVKAYEEAAAVAERAFQEKPENAEDHAAMAFYLQRANRDEEALQCFEKALEIDPNFLLARLGYANSLSALERLSEAIAQYEELQVHHLDYKKALFEFNRSLVELSWGRFEEGWKLYENRFSDDVKLTIPRHFPFPPWDGGKVGSLLIWGEQGLGDHILYASMLREISAFTKETILETEPRLTKLMKRSFPEIRVVSLVKDRDEIGADAHLPMAGMGKFFRHKWEDFHQSPYLVADKDRATRLRESLADGDKCIVGVSWSSANIKLGNHKTANLRDLAPILLNPKIKAVDLQYGDTADERESICREFGTEITHLEEIDNTNDIDGLAALIEACDAVLTVSNTTAHIAGALGKPVWIMVPHAQGRLWYWFHNRRDSPWYPGARLVRQQPGQSWAGVVASLAPEILEFAQNLKIGR